MIRPKILFPETTPPKSLFKLMQDVRFTWGTLVVFAPDRRVVRFNQVSFTGEKFTCISRMQRDAAGFWKSGAHSVFAGVEFRGKGVHSVDLRCVWGIELSTLPICVIGCHQTRGGEMFRMVLYPPGYDIDSGAIVVSDWEFKPPPALENVTISRGGIEAKYGRHYLMQPLR